MHERWAQHSPTAVSLRPIPRFIPQTFYLPWRRRAQGGAGHRAAQGAGRRAQGTSTDHVSPRCDGDRASYGSSPDSSGYLLVRLGIGRLRKTRDKMRAQSTSRQLARGAVGSLVGTLGASVSLDTNSASVPHMSSLRDSSRTLVGSDRFSMNSTRQPDRAATLGPLVAMIRPPEFRPQNQVPYKISGRPGRWRRHPSAGDAHGAHLSPWPRCGCRHPQAGRERSRDPPIHTKQV
jgi:hypothetical protein